MLQYTVKKNILFIFILLLISCKNNKQQLNTIYKLEEITKADQNKLKLLETNKINKNLEIAKFNLLKIEEKKLDSIAFELIYFEYKNYINCVNTLHESTKDIERFRRILITNNNQLKNIKIDCQNLTLNKDDLNKYLTEESMIIKQTSTSIDELLYLIEDAQSQFLALNKQIENIIN